MRVEPHIVELAVLRLFAEAGACPDRPIRLDVLREHWVKTGLRASDLHAGLDYLLEAGALLSTQFEHAQVFFLSEWAFEELHRSDGEFNRIAPGDEATLAALRLRRRTGLQLGLKRRSDDAH